MNSLAVLFAVDRMNLARKLASRFGASQKKFTIAQAFEALTARSENDEARRRRNIAEAESAEIDAQLKRKKFAPISLFEHAHADYVKQQQTKVLSARYLPKEGRIRLAKELAEIEPIDPK